MLSDNSVLRAFNTLSEFIPYKIVTIREENWNRVSNSTFWNGLDYKNKWYEVLLFIIIIEVDVDYLLEIFHEVKGGNNFPWDFLCLPEFLWTKFRQKSIARLKNWLFCSTFQKKKQQKKTAVHGIQRIQEPGTSMRLEARSSHQNMKEI